jgi:glycosyltransferase involved in cell wall biosynthesis
MSRPILCFADIRFPLERANGIQTFETCAALARRGHEVRLLVRRDTTKPARDPFVYYGVPTDARLRIERVEVAGPPAARRVASLAQALWKARELGHGAVVFSRDLGFASVYLRTRSAAKVPLVYESHGFAPVVSGARPGMLSGATAASGRKQERLFRREEFVWRNADGYVTITRGLADELRERFGPRPALAVVPDGARPGHGEWTARPMGQPPVVAYSGHLYPWKGVDLLIEALADLPEVRGLVIGGYPNEPDLERLRARATALGLGARVTFTGMVPPPEVATRLGGADVLVVPNQVSAVSARYTSPLKLFEYLAMGRAIVAPDLPAFREIVGDRRNALLFEAGNAAALGASIRQVIDDPGLAAAIGRTAFETAREYSWDRRAERIDAIFQEVGAQAKGTEAAGIR